MCNYNYTKTITVIVQYFEFGRILNISVIFILSVKLKTNRFLILHTAMG